MSRASPDEPLITAELRVGSVLFADIVGSTGIVGAHDAETAHDIIMQAIDIAAGSVIRFGGRVNRITGDGIMALFGAPEGLAEHALGACAAALDMQGRLAAAGPARLRVGIASGEFLLHPLRAAGLAAFDATGTTPHLAARLQQAAAPGEAWISAATLATAGPRLSAEALPPLSLRGFADGQAASRLRGADVSFTRLDDLSGMEPPLLGRANECALLLDGLARASRGQGHALLLLGEAGIGKTRLLREVAARAPAGLRVLWSRALRWRSRVALHPFAPLIGQVAPDGPPGPAMASLLGDEPQDDDWHALQPSERRAATIATAIRWVLAVADAGPALIILDDLHWADEATAAVLEGILAEVSGRPLLLLLASRPGHALGPACSDLPRLDVGPLGQADAASLIRRHGGAVSQIDMIAARCGGNPLFIEHAAAQATTLPANLRALLTERVDSLPRDAREVLRLLAVLEQPVAPDVVMAAMATELEPMAIQASLVMLDDAGLLLREGLGSNERIALRHALLQEAIHLGLTRRARQAQHARIAGLSGADADMQARHSWMGGLWAQALELNEAAAGAALARYANREAVVLLDRALDALGRLPETPETRVRALGLLMRLRDPLFRLGESDRLTERLREAEGLAQRIEVPGRVSELRVMQAHHAWLTGDSTASEAMLDVLEATGRADGDAALLLRCLFQRGVIAMARRQHLACATAMAAVAAQAADGVHGGRFGLDAPLCVVALSYQARELANAGRITQARAAADACLALAREVGRPFSWVFAVLADGHVMHRAGQPAQAALRLAEALPHCDKGESDLMRMVALLLLGEAELSAGKSGAALAHLEGSERLADVMRFRVWAEPRRALIALAREGACVATV